jgi:hypothetical protein
MSSVTSVDIGSRLEPFFDDYLIESVHGDVAHRLRHPAPREVVLETNRPWEGNACGTVTVFHDGEKYRMYYRTWHIDLDATKDVADMTERFPSTICVAYSDDAIRWERPEIGLFDYEGSKRNNIVWRGIGEKQIGVSGFAPFIDTNPDCCEGEKYKAVGAQCRSTQGFLWAMVSPDGIRWELMREEPIITDGKFDSQNLSFWDAKRREYRAYIRDFHSYSDHYSSGIRGIKTATSKDFKDWSDPVWLEYPEAPNEQLYTNQIYPYYRAPHLFIGFPTRYTEREWTPALENLSEFDERKRRADFHMRYGTAVTDNLFMVSRDGRTFKRWGEAFIRPGSQSTGNWVYGDNYQSWRLVETPSAVKGEPSEISFYATEGYWRGTSNMFRRYSIRKDGFASLNATLSGGEVITRPVRFAGDRLYLNLSTSGAGSIRVEIRDLDGSPLPGFTLNDCWEIIGDCLDQPVQWKNGYSVKELIGKPVRLRFELHDADLFAFHFG